MLDVPRELHFLAIAIVIFFGIGLHEFAHCKVADLAGDPTPRLMGRVTLNLFKHFELMGTIMIIVTSLTGIGIGWGKPAPMRPDKMRNPRWDFFMAVAAGPLSNLIQAGIWAILYRLLGMGGLLSSDSFLTVLLLYGVMVNIGLMLFNLIPLGMLDGHWLVGLLMPEKARYHWFKFNQQMGVFLLLGIVLLSQSVGLPLLDFIDIPARRMTFFLLGL